MQKTSDSLAAGTGALADRTWPRGARGQTAPAAAAARRSQRGSRPWAPRNLILILILLCVLQPVPVASPIITELDRVRQQPAASLTGKCPPGFYLPKDSEVCIACIEKKNFTSHYNSFSSCQPCSQCPSDKVETAPCTRTKDTQCECKNGTYQDKDSPEFCLACTLRCPDGKVQAKACGPWNDLECVDQQSGTQAYGESPVPGEPVTTSLEAPTAPSLSSGLPWWGILCICIGVVVGLLLLVIYICKSCNLSGSKVATKIRSRGWFWCSQTSGETEALDNACNLAINIRDSQPSGETEALDNACNLALNIRDSQTSGETEALDSACNLAINIRDSLSSEQEQEEPVQPAAGETQHLLGQAGADGSQMRRKLLVPANNKNPIETLRECFYVFSMFAPFNHWKQLMRSVGLTDNDIAIAQKQALNPRDGLYEMLTIWVNTTGKAASVNTLLASLEEMKETLAKEMIEEHLVRSGKYVYEGGEAGSAVSSKKDLF